MIKNKENISTLSDFNILNKVNDYRNYVRINILTAIPAVHRDLRIRFCDESYNLAKYLFYATFSKGNVRMKYLIDMKVTISLLDMLSTDVLNYNLIPKKKILGSIKRLEVIKNIVYAWIINEEKKKE